MNVDTTTITVSITTQAYNDLMKLAERQNTSHHNLVDRLIRQGVYETYQKWPNLKEKP